MEKSRIEEILHQFSGKKVLVVGDVVIDHYVYGVVERLNPEAPVPILAAQEESDATGGAGNTAKNLAMLGADTRLIGVVGNDTAAEKYKDLAKNEGYTPIVISDASRPTTQKARYLVGSQQLLRVDHEKTHNVSSEIEEELITAIQNEAEQGIDAILISDYAKGVVTQRVAEAILELKSKGILIAADIKPSRAPFFSGVDFVTPNRKEAHEILGFNMHEQGGKNPQELAKGLSEKLNTNVYLTLSADGVYVYTKDGFESHLPQDHQPEVFDPSGAGDTVAAVAALSILAQASPEEVAVLMNASGAVVVQKVGSVGVTQDEILQMLTHQHG